MSLVDSSVGSPALHERTPSNDRVGLSSLWSQQFAVAVDAGPVAVDKGHRIAADGAIRRRPLVEDGQRRQLEIIVIRNHRQWRPYSRGFILSCNAFSALSRLGTPTNVNRPSMIVAGTARTE